LALGFAMKPPQGTRRTGAGCNHGISGFDGCCDCRG
jgi:hypothetical protein